MPLFFIITLIISLDDNDDVAVAAENENGNEINNGQLNDPNEINDENQNLGQPIEQPAVGGNQGNEIINHYITNN